jgi:ribosomal protein L2
MKIDKKMARLYLKGYPYYPTMALARRGVTSGASRNIQLFQRRLPLQSIHKELMLYKRWGAGRSQSGRVVLRTRGKCNLHLRKPFINYSFRDTSFCFIAGFFLIPRSAKLVSLVFTASGTASYLVSSTKHKIFALTRMRGVVWRRFISSSSQRLLFTECLSAVPTSEIFISILWTLPKNKPVSLIEKYPGYGVRYARSPGTSGRLLKMDSRTGNGLLLLPSKMKTSVSIYGIGSEGTVALPLRNKLRNTSAGYLRRHGYKSMVRGIAMNPIDHPHGGKTNSLRYPRTP